MAALTSVSFAAITQSTDRKVSVPSTCTYLASNFYAFKLRLPYDSCNFRSANSSSRMAVHCMSTATGKDQSLSLSRCFVASEILNWKLGQLNSSEEFVLQYPPTVSETKSNFLKAYKRPIPSIYNSVLQELIVQQHLMRYKRSYQYDPVFALGFVTVYDQLMDGYPSDEDREAIFKAYIEALNEDPAQYRADAKKLEEWARSQSASSLVDFASREGEVEGILKDISARAGSKGSFSYSRFFAVGLFRLLELSNATEPTILDKLCLALNVNKKSVDRDLDVYRNLLSKLVQAKELLKEYVDREKKKVEERTASQKANEAVTKCLADYQSAAR
ncbi:protein THYLAKOID FORMATION1, chloroplastic [Sesamum angolense]|uniref:Protein THYLAKOID FORMATION1, chloroplastic n=1 Tax=Sesamum angolense TaxID=2727404 RepID=A0AAE2BU77_9LAMI|nr:protein THYLAKOID FORMATION1, chloroplastic [Sesamum angolense]